MKQFFLSLLLFSFNIYFLPAQISREYILNYDERDFCINDDNDGNIQILSPKYFLYPLGSFESNQLPFISIGVLVGPTEVFSDVQCITDTLLIQNTNNSTSFPKLNTFSMVEMDAFSANQSNSPVIEYSGTHSIDGYRILFFKVYPFELETISHSLLFHNKIRFTIHLSNHNPAEKITHTGGMNDNIRKLVINYEEKENLYGDDIEIRQNESFRSFSDNYKYLIISSDSLKGAFFPLARWKTQKGVKAKIITVEYIDSAYANCGLNRMERIKSAILDEHTLHQIQYVLLGGDVDAIPTMICRMKLGNKWHNVPTDLYYCCLNYVDALNWDNDNNGISGEERDSLSFDFSIYLTRAPVISYADAESFVKRIIQYEQNPRRGEHFNDILLSGTSMVTFGDSECAGEVLAEDELHSWNGQVLSFYDSCPLNGINFNRDSFQEQLSKGYSFVNVTSHGDIDGWKDTRYGSCYYTSEDALSLINGGNTIITTEACMTNCFNDTTVQSLSEVFFRNPDSGILGYFGCSDDGFTSGSSNCFAGLSSGVTKQFYYYIQNDSLHRFSNAATMARWLLIQIIDRDIFSRILFFGLNPIGDPEMPVFINTPMEFTQAGATMDNTTLTISTGEDDCRVCVMSYDDDGFSLYNVCTVDNNYTLNNVFCPVSVCITKPGFLPEIFILGETLYVQNETVTNHREYRGNHIYVGSDVTNQKEFGPVLIRNGSTKIKAHDSLKISKDFFVEKGAELFINK